MQEGILMKKHARARTQFDLDVTPNAYGFGHDWTLVKKTGKKKSRYWLGQDAKVTSRMLGMNFDQAVSHYSGMAGSNQFEKVKPFIVSDIVRATGISRRRRADPWDFSVQ